MLVAACGKIDTPVVMEEPVPVSFSTYAQRSTKADASYVAPGGDFATGAKIGVFGFYHNGNGSTDGSWSGDGSSNIPDFMYNQTVTKQSDGSWSYSPVKYWPNETGSGASSAHVDKLSFWGYYPRITESAYTTDNTPMYSGTDAELRFWQSGSTSVAYGNTTSGLPSVTFTQSTDITKQVDLMFTTLDPTKDLTKPSLSGKVQLTFRHALSLVQFNITSGGASLPDGASVTIKTLELTNVATKGNCPDPTASFATVALAETFWTGVGTIDSMTLPAGMSDTNFILMPQELPAEGSTGHSAVKLSITYDISFPATDDPNDTITYKDNEAEAWLWSDTGTPYGVKRWLPGRKYTYNISAGLDVIEFSEVFTDTWATPVEYQL